jgi:large conductance mechanosensitive channel
MTTIGPFLTAVFAFLIMAFVVYFFIVKPYELAKEKFVQSEEEDAAPNADTVLLTEIRDALVRDRT